MSAEEDLARLLEEAKKASNYLHSIELLAEPKIRDGAVRCGHRLYELIVEIEKKQREQATPTCEHEAAPSEGRCPGCGMVMVYCRPCSVSNGGADVPIYHGEPACSAVVVPEYYAEVQRAADMPKAGENTCSGTCGLGKMCVLREGHSESHCSRTGTEWPQ